MGAHSKLSNIQSLRVRTQEYAILTTWVALLHTKVLRTMSQRLSPKNYRQATHQEKKKKMQPRHLNQQLAGYLAGKLKGKCVLKMGLPQWLTYTIQQYFKSLALGSTLPFISLALPTQLLDSMTQYYIMHTVKKNPSSQQQQTLLVTESFQNAYTYLCPVLYLINCGDSQTPKGNTASWHQEGIRFSAECGVRCKPSNKEASAFQKAELFSVSRAAKKSLRVLLQGPEL